MNFVEIKERNSKITKKLYEAALLVNNNLDTSNPVVIAVIGKIADAVHELDEISKAFEEEPETKKRTIVAINDDGTIDGYLSTAEYAKEAHISAIVVREWIREGRLDSLAIANGTRRTGVVHFIKQGTPRPKPQKRGRKKGEQANG